MPVRKVEGLEKLELPRTQKKIWRRSPQNNLSNTPGGVQQA
jgi:hypothetical protein